MAEELQAPSVPAVRTVPMRVVAQDPSVLAADGKRILTSVIDVPAEDLLPGPRGDRVHVVDYDCRRRTPRPPGPRARARRSLGRGARLRHPRGPGLPTPETRTRW
jgi:hypothetical protein